MPPSALRAKVFTLVLLWSVWCSHALQSAEVPQEVQKLQVDPQQPGHAEHRLVDHIWDQFLNGDGVVIKMLECGYWNPKTGIRADIKSCWSQSLSREPGSLLRFDLPITAFPWATFLGFLFTDVPAEKKLCAAAFDANLLSCSEKPSCPSNYTAQAVIDELKDPKHEEWAKCTWLGKDGWEKAFAVHRAIIEHKAETDEPVNYNQVNLKADGTPDGLTAIMYRNDSSWPQEIKWVLPRDPIVTLAMVQLLATHIQAAFNIKLPIVEVRMPFLENSAKSVVARWKTGKHSAVNDIFFAVTDDDPRMKLAAEKAKQLGDGFMGQYLFETSASKSSSAGASQNRHEEVQRRSSTMKRVMKVSSQGRAVNPSGITGPNSSLVKRSVL